MADDYASKAEEFERKAEKKLNGWAIFGSKYEDAADLFSKAANFYKLAKSWDKAGSTYVRLAECNMKLPDSGHDAGSAYVDAAHSYKKISSENAIACLVNAVKLFKEIGRTNMVARYYKEIAELYELEDKYEKAIENYEEAAELFQNDDLTTMANQCKQKIAQFASQIEDYPRAIEIYEEIARYSLGNNLLKYGVKGHLLNAGICQLCRGDVVAITNSLDRYKDLDPTFAGTRECKFLSDMAEAMDEEDVGRFTEVVKEFDSMTQLDGWKTTMLLRVKESVKAKELEEEDLT